MCSTGLWGNKGDEMMGLLPIIFLAQAPIFRPTADLKLDISLVVCILACKKCTDALTRPPGLKDNHQDFFIALALIRTMSLLALL
jgi:hypothetical protein